jgi:hypothetical protein
VVLLNVAWTKNVKVHTGRILILKISRNTDKLQQILLVGTATTTQTMLQFKGCRPNTVKYLKWSFATNIGTPKQVLVLPSASML